MKYELARGSSEGPEQKFGEEQLSTRNLVITLMTQTLTGDQLDHYRLESMIARTGVASIFRGIDTRTGRLVAIKIPHPEVETDPVFFERFHREQEIGVKMDHPGVMKVLPEEHHSQTYMVMEWVEGKLLRQLLNEQKKLAPERAVKIAVGIARALDHLHGHGIVHRDLRPDHVMVDAEDDIKLIDFGIASDLGARRVTFANLSQTMGTPDYISPEQVKGKRGDTRSDLYTLGVMLYEMLTGELPFQGNNPFAIMHDRLLNHPVPPRELDSHISPHLQEIIYRALERDPTNRYNSAHEFARDLEHQDQVGIADRPELRNWKRRHSLLMKRILLYILLALIPIVIFALMFYMTRHS
jgi:serine/threonine-protein kinase